ncbi:MAG TPA: HutP family protein [Candidatus Rifleibacterium sp.]|nr:HutP family protein [Candidatus Rifleibacterium sp.]HPT46511.1 HutP family protein [Candidatus Rifleibacterium sp.]
MGIRVKEIMDKNPVIVDHQQTIFGLREIVILRQPECILVTDSDKKLVGLLTPSHLAMIADVEIEEKVSSVMERKFRRINANMSVREAAAMLSASELEALPVVDNNDDLVGVVTYRDIVKDLVEDREDQMLTPESAVVYLAMTKDPEQEEYWLQKVTNKGYRAAITQVGATAEKLPIKLREATIVAAIARSVIKEDSREKFSVSNAVRDIFSQCYTINPGLGGGFKVAIVRGEGRIAVAAFGRCGHALSNGNEQIFMGSNII